MLAVLDNSSLLFQLQIQATLSSHNFFFQNPNSSFCSGFVSQDPLRTFPFRCASQFCSFSQPITLFRFLILQFRYARSTWSAWWTFWIRITCFWFSVASDILNRDLCSFCGCFGKMNGNLFRALLMSWLSQLSRHYLYREYESPLMDGLLIDIE